jgi:hypothetical protein
MASYDDSPDYRFWLAVERPVIVNRVAFYNDLVGNFRAPSWTRDRERAFFLRAFFLHNALALNKARAHLALGDRLHELRRLTQTVRAVVRTLPLALVFAGEVWLTELEAVAAQYAALGPIGADPGPLRTDEYLLLFC